METSLGQRFLSSWMNRYLREAVLDVNDDSLVNILDLTPIVSQLGRRGENPADV